MSTKQELRKNVTDGNTRKAIDVLKAIIEKVKDYDLQEEIDLQSVRYETYRKEKRSRTSNDEELIVEYNRINLALIQIIDKLPDEISSHSKNKIKPAIIIIVALGIFGLIWWLFDFRVGDFNSSSIKIPKTTNDTIEPLDTGEKRIDSVKNTDDTTIISHVKKEIENRILPSEKEPTNSVDDNEDQNSDLPAYMLVINTSVRLDKIIVDGEPKDFSLGYIELEKGEHVFQIIDEAGNNYECGEFNIKKDKMTLRFRSGTCYLND